MLIYFSRLIELGLDLQSEFHLSLDQDLKTYLNLFQLMWLSFNSIDDIEKVEMAKTRFVPQNTWYQ